MQFQKSLKEDDSERGQERFKIHSKMLARILMLLNKVAYGVWRGFCVCVGGGGLE